jgi:glutamate-ammonia-ligase adenylyltransferase
MRSFLSQTITSPLNLSGLSEFLRENAPHYSGFFTDFLSNNKQLSEKILCIHRFSPFLKDIIYKYPLCFMDLLQFSAQKSFDEVMVDLKALDFEQHSFANLQTEIRQIRLKIALIIAWGDIAENWTLAEVTKAISLFADLIIKKSFDYLIHQNDYLDSHQGIILLAAGKLGASELNYSSDVDLLFFYDETKIDQDDLEVKQILVNLVQQFVKLIQDKTEDGYVFRVDLRLRPDPISTPNIISFSSAVQYYTNLGQNWERAALIRARQIAGDKASGHKFFGFLHKFIWRKNLDFETIQDIQSIKRQVESRLEKKAEDLSGYNVKLGHGGIREIEFYIQTQQLIYGGRNKALQGKDTIASLEKLARHEHISQAAQKDLTAAYQFYRFVEHRLQMQNDRQTHELPRDKERQHDFALFAGYKDEDAFLTELLTHIKKTRKHYRDLFKESPQLADHGNLVFTGMDNDPETIKNLISMGFDAANDVSNTIRGWHHGRYDCLKALKSRQYLTELVPIILKNLSKTSNPSYSFIQFDRFLSLISEDFNVFSLFYHNTKILEKLCHILGAGPDLSDWLGKNPNLLQNLISLRGNAPLVIDERVLNENLDDKTSLAEIEDFLRRWVKDHKFFAGIHTLFHYSSFEEIQTFLAALADHVLRLIYKAVLKEFEAEFGVIKGAEFAILALGNYGGKKLLLGSDLDLVMIYDTPSLDVKSNGKTVLSAPQYYIKLGQKLLASLVDLKSEGRLYEVDMRLRPQGNQGPLVTSFEAFDQYYHHESWVVEKMALSRGRVVVGSNAFHQKIMASIQSVFKKQITPQKAIPKILEVHEKIKEEYGARKGEIFNMKQHEGGILDIEFIVQYHILLHAAQHPQLISGDILYVLLQLKKLKILGEDFYVTLSKDYTYLNKLRHYFFVSMGPHFLDQPFELQEKVFCDSYNCKDLCEDQKQNLEAVYLETHQIFRSTFKEL